MTAAVALVIQPPRHLLRFLRSPKGILLCILAGMAALGAAANGADGIVRNLLIAAAIAAAIDVAVALVRHDEWIFPDGAILTALIVAFVLRPQEPVGVLVLAVTIALASKHLIRTRWSNIFNPAAVALVLSGVLLGAGQSWWGALPDLGVLGVAVLLTAGAFIAHRINKSPMVLVFLGTYFALFTIAGVFGHGAAVSEVFRTPDIHAVLFFALFMLDDPPTSPVRYEDQVVYGISVATLAYFLFMTLGAVYYLPLALLAGNSWESLRRLYVHRGRHRATAV